MNRNGRSRGEVTERDRSALAWMVRHSAVTIRLAAKYRFGSLAMASRRLRVLVSWGLIRQISIGRRMSVYVATAKGAELAGLGIRPPRSGLMAEIEHSLLLCEVTENLARRWMATVVTEREIRVDLLRRQRAGEVIGGRIPDAVLVMSDDGRRIAIEVDRTAKRSSHLANLITGLLPRLGKGAEWAAVFWGAPTPAAAIRYRRIAEELAATDVVWVGHLSEVID
jgi:hypothetical protein